MNKPRKVVPQDILDAMRESDSDLHHLQRVIELQSELIEMQRDTIELQKNSIGYLKEISALKDEFLRQIVDKLQEQNQNQD